MIKDLLLSVFDVFQHLFPISCGCAMQSVKDKYLARIIVDFIYIILYVI